MSLKDIFGQENVISFLLSEIKSGNIKNSYIFYGPRGVGKKFTAIQFAKSIICKEPKNFLSCDRCIHCEKIDTKTHPDVFVVDFDFQERLLNKTDKQKNIKIDTIRFVKEQSFLSPYLARYKIFIIDEAQTMQREASNSLLKILEEPPLNCIFILISSALGILPKTVISRCELVKFYPLKKDILIKFLDEKELNNIIYGSMEDVEYIKKVEILLKEINSSEIQEIQYIAEELKKNKQVAKYFLYRLTKDVLNKVKYDNKYFDFLLELEFCLKQLKYNIDIGLLLETILIKAKELN